jgi:hypothetical protein
MRFAYAGATVPQMNAIFGWSGFRMAMHYIEAADRRRFGLQAGKLLANGGGENDVGRRDTASRAS